MPCYACDKSYGFFSKEVGCPNCGFSFCTKCLKKTIEVPRFNNERKKVCLSCYDKLSNPGSSVNNASSLLDSGIPPEEAENIPQPTSLDDVIKARLLSLKKDRLDNMNAPECTDKDISIRVANLKGVPYSDHKNTDILLATDTRTDEEKTRDLVRQFLEEKTIDDATGDGTTDPIADIERRLAALKGTTQPAVDLPSKKDSDEEELEEDQVKKILNKYMEEAKLPDSELTEEEKEFVEDASRRSKKEDVEELPWCVICNEDADLRYQGDLFCKSCYKEVKEDE